MNPSLDKGRFYRPELDALRLFAFLSVFLRHVSSSRFKVFNVIRGAGAFGVCLFFFLSAFLITELFWRERERTGTIHLGAFYIRRILRIWPLYFAALALACLLGIVYHPYHVEGPRLFANLALAGNWYIWAKGWSDNPLLSPLWSISVEEQFYLLIPLIAKFGNRAAINVAAIVALGMSYATMLWLGHHPEIVQSYVWVNSFVQFQFFAAGSLVSNWLHGRAPKMRSSRRIGLFLLGSVCWIASSRLGISIFLHPNASPLIDAAGYAIIMIGTLAIFFAFLGMDTSILPKPIIYLGTISYGLYVYHTTILESLPIFFRSAWSIPGVPLAGSLFSLALTCGIAALSYRYFEQPFVRLKKRFSFVPSK